jgi:hypothetical protein
MRVREKALALPLVLAMGIACNRNPVTAPEVAGTAVATADQGAVRTQAKGTGLVLNSVTGLTLPLIGSLGDVNINQAVITNFALVENTVGQIVGLEATGVLKLTGGVLGTDVLTENFTTTASLTSSGPGQCDLITIDLGSISVDALAAKVDIPAANLTARGSGAVGSLLCNLGSLLGGLTGGGTASGAQGLVNAINNQI